MPLPPRRFRTRARDGRLTGPPAVPARCPTAVNRRDPNAGNPQALGDLLSRYLVRSGLGPKVEAASVIPEWEERVGPAIAAVTEPLRVNEGTLIVAVRTSAWMMELNMMKADLMRHVNAGKTDGRIKQIVFVMGG